MTLQSFPSAIYHCSVPFKSLSAVYGSSNGGRQSNVPPIPAWPDIEDIDQWCCLPTLKRAVYIHDPPQESLMDFIDFLEQYLLQQIEKAEQGIQEQTSVFVNLAAMLYTRISELPCSISDMSKESIRNYLHGVNWDSLRYLCGEKNVFTNFHEMTHSIVGKTGIYSAFRQNMQSDAVHHLLQIISSTPQLSNPELQQLWREFRVSNGKLLQLVRKFEVVEETVANLWALSLLEPQIRDSVIGDLYEYLKVKGEEFFFNFFLTAVTTDRISSLPIDRAESLDQLWHLGHSWDIHRVLALMELVTIKVDCSDISPASDLNALFDSIYYLYYIAPFYGSKSLNTLEILDMLDIDAVDQWFISVAPGMKPLLSAVKEYRLASEKSPLVILRGSVNSAELEFHHLANINGEPISESVIKENESLINEEAFWESLRQQINWAIWAIRVRRSAACELTCPHKRADQPCCGREESMKKLWTRLPKPYQAVLTSPSCGIKA
jgi:hypothetical protein